MEFQIFGNGKVVTDFALSGAYLFGTDGIALRRAQIAYKDGLIVCSKANLETAGLALLWPVEGFGKVLLSTTCLPEKRTRYILNVELARAKLMHILNKREDWSFFNSIEGLEDLLNESRDLLIRAIQKISDPPAAAQLADESLKKALDFSESLAIRQAESLLRIRGRNRGFGRRCLGCCVDQRQIANVAYVRKLVESFGFVTIPADWSLIEMHKGTYNFSKVDACMHVLGKKRLAICVGPLLCFSKPCLPRWLLQSGVGFEKVREAAYRFIYRIVSRYAGKVHSWRVVTGLNAFNHFGFTFEQVLELTRAATMAVKAATNRGVKIVEICNPWGEYYATTPNTIPPLVYLDMVVQSGINFDAFGLQLRFGKNQAGMHIRDMMQLSSVLDYFGAVAKPLYITEVEVPGADESGSHNGNLAGMWHGPWDEARLGQWVEQFYKIALSKPFVDTVTYSHLTDVKDGELAKSGLFTAELEPKQPFKSLKKLEELVFSR